MVEYVRTLPGGLRDVTEDLANYDRFYVGAVTTEPMFDGDGEEPQRTFVNDDTGDIYIEEGGSGYRKVTAKNRYDSELRAKYSKETCDSAQRSEYIEKGPTEEGMDDYYFCYNSADAASFILDDPNKIKWGYNSIEWAVNFWFGEPPSIYIGRSVDALERVARSPEFSNEERSDAIRNLREAKYGLDGIYGSDVSQGVKDYFVSGAWQERAMKLSIDLMNDESLSSITRLYVAEESVSDHKICEANNFCNESVDGLLSIAKDESAVFEDRIYAALKALENISWFGRGNEFQQKEAEDLLAVFLGDQYIDAEYITAIADACAKYQLITKNLSDKVMERIKSFAGEDGHETIEYVDLAGRALLIGSKDGYPDVKQAVLEKLAKIVGSERENNRETFTAAWWLVGYKYQGAEKMFIDLLNDPKIWIGYALESFLWVSHDQKLFERVIPEFKASLVPAIFKRLRELSYDALEAFDFISDRIEYIFEFLGETTADDLRRDAIDTMIVLVEKKRGKFGSIGSLSLIEKVKKWGTKEEKERLAGIIDGISDDQWENIDGNEKSRLIDFSITYGATREIQTKALSRYIKAGWGSIGGAINIVAYNDTLTAKEKRARLDILRGTISFWDRDQFDEVVKHTTFTDAKVVEVSSEPQPQPEQDILFKQ